MYCKYCGKPLSDGARFCGFCGKDQTEKIVDNSTVTSSVTVDKQFIPEFEVPNAKETLIKCTRKAKSMV